MNEEVEMIWLQYKQRETRDLYLGLYYGEQESRTTREEKMSKIEREIICIKENRPWRSLINGRVQHKINRRQ